MVNLNKGATVELVKTLSDDLRTGADGEVYSSAGAALRTQSSNLKNDITLLDSTINNSAYYKNLNFINAVIDSATGEIDAENVRGWCDETYFECLTIDTVKSRLSTPDGYLLYCYYYDENKNFQGVNSSQTQTIRLNTTWKYVRFGVRNTSYTPFALTIDIKSSVILVIDKSAIENISNDNEINFTRGYILNGVETTGYDFYATAYKSDFLNTELLKSVEIPTEYKMLVSYYDANLEYKTQAIYNAGVFSVISRYPYVRLCIRQYNNDVFILNKNILDTFRFYQHTLLSVVNGDICPQTSDTVTSNGVTYAPVKFGIIVDGTAQTSSYYNLYSNQSNLPDKIYPGKTYYFEFNGYISRLVLHVRYYGSDNEWHYLYNGYKSAQITIPVDAIGLQIRLCVNTGFSFNRAKVAVRVFDISSMEYSSMIKHKICRPMITIIYDDGEDEFAEYIMPIIQNKKVPIATAIISEYAGVVNGTMDYDTISQCYNNGAEVLCHAVAHTEAEWNELTERGVADIYRKTYHNLCNKGYNIPSLMVYSGQSSTYPVCYNAAKNTFSYAIAAAARASIDTPEINKLNDIDPYYIKRCYSDGASVDQMKNWIDTLVTDGTGWQVWMRHNTRARASMGISDTAQEDANKISAAIDYAIQRGVPIVTVQRGLREYFNE